MTKRRRHARLLSLLLQLPMGRQQRVLHVVVRRLLHRPFFEQNLRNRFHQHVGQRVVGLAVEQPEQPFGIAEARQAELRDVKLVRIAGGLSESDFPRWVDVGVFLTVDWNGRKRRAVLAGHVNKAHRPLRTAALQLLCVHLELVVARQIEELKFLRNEDREVDFVELIVGEVEDAEREDF